MNLYEACLTLLQVYSRNNLGRQSVDAAAEEEQYQDLLLIMELLTNLLSKELIDFSDTGGRAALLVPSPRRAVCAEWDLRRRFRSQTGARSSLWSLSREGGTPGPPCSALPW